MTEPLRYAAGPNVEGLDCGCGGCPDCRPGVAEVATITGMAFHEVLDLVRRSEDATLRRIVELRRPDLSTAGAGRAARRRVERAQQRAAKASTRKATP